MTDNKIKVGDICIYHYADGNGSVNVVEVTKIVDSDKSKIKCVQVIHDNSGNGWFKYMLEKGNEMMASNKYLHKICCCDLIKAKAYKEFAEKFENRILSMLTTATLEEKEIICACIGINNNVLKELVGEDNASKN